MPGKCTITYGFYFYGLALQGMKMLQPQTPAHDHALKGKSLNF